MPCVRRAVHASGERRQIWQIRNDPHSLAIRGVTLQNPPVRKRNCSRGRPAHALFPRTARARGASDRQTLMSCCANYRFGVTREGGPSPAVATAARYHGFDSECPFAAHTIPKPGRRFVIRWKHGMGKHSSEVARRCNVGGCGRCSVLWNWTSERKGQTGKRRPSGRWRPRRGRRSNRKRGPNRGRRPSGGRRPSR